MAARNLLQIILVKSCLSKVVASVPGLFGNPSGAKVPRSSVSERSLARNVGPETALAELRSRVRAVPISGAMIRFPSQAEESRRVSTTSMRRTSDIRVAGAVRRARC